MHLPRCRMPFARARHSRHLRVKPAPACTPRVSAGQPWREQSVARGEPRPRPIAVCHPFRHIRERTPNGGQRQDGRGDDT